MPSLPENHAQYFQRSARIVWRLAPDRVLVRRVDHLEPFAEDLLGAAALVWVATDEPRCVQQLADETDLSEETVRQALELLVNHCWIEQTK
jgi:hypothetical protein